MWVYHTLQLSLLLPSRIGELAASAILSVEFLVSRVNKDRNYIHFGVVENGLCIMMLLFAVTGF